MDEEAKGDGKAFKGKAGPPPLTQAQLERARLRKSTGFIDPTMTRTSLYSTLSGQKTGERFSFSKASRFKSASDKTSMELQRSKSSPAWSHQTSTTCSDAGGFQEASIDFTVPSTEPSRVFSGAEASLQEPSRGSHAGAAAADSDEEYHEAMPGTPTRYPRPPETDRLSAPRLEGSLERLGEPQQRSAHPRARSYDPAQTLGSGTSSTFHGFPHWTFGGGNTRMPDFDKNKEHLEKVLGTSSSKKGKVSRAAVTLMDLKDAIRPSQKPQAPLSRGFGSQKRLQVKGGPFQLPISPGPGSYELMRSGDPQPVWLQSGRTVSSSCNWSTRTGERADLRNRIGTQPNLGPGDSILDTSFKATGPTPVLGHPAHDIAKQEFAGTDPSLYNVPSMLCRDRSPIHTVGTGKRTDFVGMSPLSPGPAKYNPKDDVCHRYAPASSFGRSCRVHESDLVDPDEPPGPGAHTVRKDPKVTDKPSVLFSKDKRMREQKGLVVPGPGIYKIPSSLEKSGRSIATLLPRPVEETIGPCDTAGADPYATDSLCHDSGPSWGELVNRSSVRKPPWREISQPPVFELKSGEKLIMTNVPMQFKATGPKWSMMPRREERWKSVINESEAMIMASSIG